VVPHDAGFPEPTGNPPQNNPDLRPVAGRIDPASAAPPETAPPALASGPDFGSLLRSLRRRWMAAATLGTILAAVAGIAAWYFMSPKYTAFATVRVNSDRPSIQDLPYNPNNASFNTFIRSQAALLRSRPVIHAAMKRDDVKPLNLAAAHPDLASFLEDELKVEMSDNNEFLTLTFSYPDPTVATTVVKAVSECYMDQTGYGERSGRAEKVAELEKAYNQMLSGLNSKKQNHKRLAENLGTADPLEVKRIQEDVQNALRDKRSEKSTVERELFKARNDEANMLARANALATETVSDEALEKALEADAIARPLLIRLANLKGIVREYELINAGNEPTPRVAKGQIKQIEPQVEERRVKLRAEMQQRLAANLAKELKTAQEQISINKQFLDKQLAELDAQMKEIGDKAVKLSTAPAELDTLARGIETDAKLLDELGSKLARERIEQGAPARIAIHQEADLQKKDNKKQIMAAVAVPVGVLFLVCMGVAWADYRQRRVHSAQEVANGLGIRVVGAVPAVPNFERLVIGASGQPDLEGQPVLESVDAIRTLLLCDSPRQESRVILVTSAVAGEGKTTVASHLASSLARAGRKALLIDADLRNPAQHQLFELPMQPGFSEVLLGEVELEDAVLDTTLPGLAVMPAGQWDREVLQALARGGVEGVFEKLREAFDFIIVDSHPVLAATDSLLLSQRSDAVILAVLNGVSQTPRVYAAAQRLNEVGARVLGAVVSAADPDEVIAPAPATAAA
jgi:capsular exopolysaccharide synthesis family protein